MSSVDPEDQIYEEEEMANEEVEQDDDEKWFLAPFCFCSWKCSVFNRV